MEIPAGVPTIVRKETRPPDIVKIEIEAREELAQSMEEIPSACKSGIPEEFPASCLDSNCPVMEVVIQGISLRVTNAVHPKLLAETIRLLRGLKC